MELKYLGTAAAEGFPSLFCVCDTCQRARKAGGKNIRTRSQALIDNTLLIDFPADTLMHSLSGNLPLENIGHCLITHSHSDHFYPSDLEMRKIGFAKPVDNLQFNIYAAESAYNETVKHIETYGLNNDNRVIAHLAKPFEAFNIDKYTVTPLPADHDPKATPVIYLIEDGKSSLLYAHDTGMFKEEVWDFLQKRNKPLTFASLDCTAGLLEGWETHHLGLDTCIKLRQLMYEKGIADANTRFCLNHFSHNCLATYDDLLPKAEENGFELSYDGMSVEF